MTTEVKEAYMFLYKASSLSAEFHKGQVDKAGQAYYFHPKRVAGYIANDWDFDSIDDEEKVFVLECGIVAFLHDVLEDTTCTEEYLKEQGFSEKIIEAIKSVTRNEGESYGDFVKRAAENPYGKVVKLYDLKDNLDVTRFKKISEEDISRINKYLKWYHYLSSKM